MDESKARRHFSYPVSGFVAPFDRDPGSNHSPATNLFNSSYGRDYRTNAAIRSSHLSGVGYPSRYLDSGTYGGSSSNFTTSVGGGTYPITYRGTSGNFTASGGGCSYLSTYGGGDSYTSNYGGSSTYPRPYSASSMSRPDSSTYDSSGKYGRNSRPFSSTGTYDRATRLRNLGHDSSPRRYEQSLRSYNPLSQVRGYDRSTPHSDSGVGHSDDTSSKVGDSASSTHSSRDGTELSKTGSVFKSGSPSSRPGSRSSISSQSSLESKDKDPLISSSGSRLALKGAGTKSERGNSTSKRETNGAEFTHSKPLHGNPSATCSSEDKISTRRSAKNTDATTSRSEKRRVESSRDQPASRRQTDSAEKLASRNPTRQRDGNHKTVSSRSPTRRLESKGSLDYTSPYQRNTESTDYRNLLSRRSLRSQREEAAKLEGHTRTPMKSRVEDADDSTSMVKSSGNNCLGTTEKSGEVVSGSGKAPSSGTNAKHSARVASPTAKLSRSSSHKSSHSHSSQPVLNVPNSDARRSDTDLSLIPSIKSATSAEDLLLKPNFPLSYLYPSENREEKASSSDAISQSMNGISEAKSPKLKSISVDSEMKNSLGIDVVEPRIRVKSESAFSIPSSHNISDGANINNALSRINSEPEKVEKATSPLPQTGSETVINKDRSRRHSGQSVFDRLSRSRESPSRSVVNTSSCKSSQLTPNEKPGASLQSFATPEGSGILNTSGIETPASTREERIARYKEERRRQRAKIKTLSRASDSMDDKVGKISTSQETKGEKRLHATGGTKDRRERRHLVSSESQTKSDTSNASDKKMTESTSDTESKRTNILSKSVSRKDQNDTETVKTEVPEKGSLKKYTIQLKNEGALTSERGMIAEKQLDKKTSEAETSVMPTSNADATKKTDANVDTKQTAKIKHLAFGSAFKDCLKKEKYGNSEREQAKSIQIPKSINLPSREVERKTADKNKVSYRINKIQDDDSVRNNASSKHVELRSAESHHHEFARKSFVNEKKSEQPGNIVDIDKSGQVSRERHLPDGQRGSKVSALSSRLEAAWKGATITKAEEKKAFINDIMKEFSPSKLRTDQFFDKTYPIASKSKTFSDSSVPTKDSQTNLGEKSRRNLRSLSLSIDDSHSDLKAKTNKTDISKPQHNVSKRLSHDEKNMQSKSTSSIAVKPSSKSTELPRTVSVKQSTVSNETPKKDYAELKKKLLESPADLDDILSRNAEFLSDAEPDLTLPLLAANKEITDARNQGLSTTEHPKARRSLRKRLHRKSLDKTELAKLNIAASTPESHRSSKVGDQQDNEGDKFEDALENPTCTSDTGSLRNNQDGVACLEDNNNRALLGMERQVVMQTSVINRSNVIMDRQESLSLYSDASEFSEKFPADLDGKVFEQLTETDTSVFDSAPSAPPTEELTRRKRKDKSSKRKSALNLSTSSVDSTLQGENNTSRVDKNVKQDGANVKALNANSPAQKVAPKSHRTRSSPHTKTAPVTHQEVQQAANSVVKHRQEDQEPGSELSAALSRTNHEPAIPVSHMSMPTTTNDSNAHVSKAKLALSSKVTSAISIFSHDAPGGSDSSTSRKTDDSAVKPFRRGNNFSQLVKQFSSSDVTSSERSDSDPNIVQKRKIFTKKSDHSWHATVSSSDESNTDPSRRRPERSQSLRMVTSSRTKMESKTTQRSSSFRSDFMRNRFRTDQSDKPNEELASVLNQRSKIVEDQQIENAQQEPKEEKIVFQLRHNNVETPVDEVISDNEVAAALKARRKETDSYISDSVVNVSYDNDASMYNFKPNVVQNSEDVSVVTLASDNKSEAVVSDFSISLPGISNILNDNNVYEFQDVEASDKQYPVICIEDSNAESESYTISLTLGDSDDKGNNSPDISTNISLPESQFDVQSYVIEAATDVIENEPEPVRNDDEVVTSFTIVAHTAKLDDQEDGVSKLEKSSEDVFTIQDTRIYSDITVERQPSLQSSAVEDSSHESKQSKIKDTSVSDVITKPHSKSLSEQTTSEASDSEDRRSRGIIKRTASLPRKDQSLMDPELATIMRKRRGGDAEKQAEGERETTPDIQSLIQQDRPEGMLPEEVEPLGKKMTVLERVSHLRNKVDEERYTPQSRSGHTTPGSTHARSGTTTPKRQASNDDKPSALPGLSKELLMERLTDIAASPDSAKPRRKPFHRSRNDWRTRTQPVTLEEIKEADKLETVNSFRSLVTKKASTNVFEQAEHKKPLPVGKKTEFPQPFLSEKKVKQSKSADRHKTMPITAAELSAIPEGQTIHVDSKHIKDKTFGHLETGFKSALGSDITEENGARLIENDPSSLNVSAKTSIFRQMDEKALKERTKGKASAAKRYIERKKRERCRTLPVTEDEVKTAAEMAANLDKKKSGSLTNIRIPEPPVVNRKASKDNGNSDSDEDMSKRSLADKVRLFSGVLKVKPDPEPSKPEAPPVVKRRNRRHASRFSTQPVTSEEVQAARISPLAMSLVKPPDPEILQGLPLSAQRDLMAQHAEAYLQSTGSRPNSRPTSQPGSRRSSITETSDADNDTKGILKSPIKSNTSKEVIGIMKDEPKPSPERIRSILKTDIEKKGPSEPKSILKNLDSPERKDPTKIADSEPKGILKSETESKPTMKQSESEYRGILKHLEGALGSNEHRGMLKKESTFEKIEPRGILKKESSFESKKVEPIKSVLKTMDSKEARDSMFQELRGIKGILKKDSSTESLDKDFNQSALVSSSQSETDVNLNVANGEKAENLISDQKEGSPINGESGVIRRKTRDSRKGQTERYRTQPTTPTTDVDTTPLSGKYTSDRHKTQPVTPEERKQAEATSRGSIMKGGSVSDRLNSLKQSGQDEWKKRISPEVVLRQKLNSPVRPKSIADLKGALSSSQGGWKNRVEESDAKSLTVSDKINKKGLAVTDSPILAARVKRSPKKEVYRCDSGSSAGSTPVMSPSTPTKEFRVPIPTELISSDPLFPSDSQASEEEQSEPEPIEVEIPTIDHEEFELFFSVKKVETKTESIEVNVADFDQIFMDSEDILMATRKLRPPQRRRAAQGKNPLRSSMVEVKQAYTVTKTGIAEKEVKRIKKEGIAKDAGFAQEALAGLASTENFAKVPLRKMDTSTPTTPGGQRYEPYKDLMLLQVKGRRHIQTRLVEPSYKSMNSGDCYVLVTPTSVVNWVGEVSNVIEKAKSSEIALFIHQKKDLGCKINASTATVQESKQHLGVGNQFWSTLGEKQDYLASGPSEEDEVYETAITETNIVYRLDNNALVPYEEYWGCIPKYEMLKPKEILVFDFGSELYLWQGKQSSLDRRKLTLKLALKLWENGYDYSSCDINPLTPLRTLDNGGLPLVSKTRPDWAMFGKITQNMETILFREKFADWPDTSRIIQVKSAESSTPKGDILDLKPYDAKKMISVCSKPVDLVLEGTHVGRGTSWQEDMDGFIRDFDVVTLKVLVWHVLEYDHSQLEVHSQGQFHDGDTYVVRWEYMVVAAGLRNFKTNTASRRSLTGRERCAYFFWQGKNSTINEKGASALMTVELDEELGPQWRVEQGKEPPCFLNLFNGNMMIHIGKREEPDTNTTGAWRCYCVRSEYENEMYLTEIDFEIESLRSCSSFILLNVNMGLLYIWHGSQSLKHTRLLACSAANRLKKQCPLEMGLHKDATMMITEMEEGSEKRELWLALDNQDRTRYNSMLDEPTSQDHTIRLFHMTSVSGVFEALEVINPARAPDLHSPFPVLQSDLYNASQPALFILDNHREVYLWQGWWPPGEAECDNVATGSAQARFNVDRRCALETTIQYCKEKNLSSLPTAHLVFAGVEPLQFTNLFPYWKVDPSVREVNMKDGKSEGDLVLVEDFLAKVTQTRYTLEELQERPLPEGVDPSRLEAYLSDDEFEEMLGVTKDSFYLLPPWRQSKLKKDVGLF